jgi:hypothetical protein
VPASLELDPGDHFLTIRPNEGYLTLSLLSEIFSDAIQADNFPDHFQVVRKVDASGPFLKGCATSVPPLYTIYDR